MIEIKHKETGKVLLTVVTPSLQGADLSGRNLAGADLYKADLSGADLTRCNLDGADLEGANLRGANLFEATVRGTNLYSCSLWGADLTGVRFDRRTRWPDRFQPEERGAVAEAWNWRSWLPVGDGVGKGPAPRQKADAKKQAEEPKLIFGSPGAIASKNRAPGIQIVHRTSGLTLHRVQGDTLEGAALANLELRGASLRTAKLKGANLAGADLTGADMHGADLREANAEGAELVKTDLTGADMRDCNLRGANLRGAILRGASIRGAALWGAHLKGARYDIGTLWPQGFDPQARGAVKEG